MDFYLFVLYFGFCAKLVSLSRNEQHTRKGSAGCMGRGEAKVDGHSSYHVLHENFIQDPLVALQCNSSWKGYNNDNACPRPAPPPSMHFAKKLSAPRDRHDQASK